MDFVLFFIFIFAVIAIFIAIGPFNSGLIRGRVQHDEWTEFENGVPVRGVGYRGYWTNKATFGDSSFRQRKDGTWYDTKTGEDLVVMTFSEMMEKYGPDRKE